MDADHFGPDMAVPADLSVPIREMICARGWINRVHRQRKSPRHRDAGDRAEQQEDHDLAYSAREVQWASRHVWLNDCTQNRAAVAAARSFIVSLALTPHSPA